jgi:hypothetical protein
VAQIKRRLRGQPLADARHRTAGEAALKALQRQVWPRRPRLAAVLALALLAGGCMVVPRTTHQYDPDCQLVHKRVTLDVQQVNAVAHCGSGADCAGQLAFLGLVGAASAVVSGSVALVGNVAYWLERQGQCRPPDPAPRPGATQAGA